MKYSNMQTYGKIVAFDLVCSHGDCTQKLKGDENYCPVCGSPLKKIPSTLDKEKVVALINENINKLLHPIEANEKIF